MALGQSRKIDGHFPNMSIYTLWLFNITMANSPFIDGLPIKNIKNDDFPLLC
jgi:hypothetical protein